MSNNRIVRSIFKALTKYEIISIGTKYFPTTPLEIEYVEMFNFTKTMLLEIEKAEITTESIFHNLLRDVGAENIPQNHKFYELKPAENRIEEYALVSNIIMGSDRYLYIELSAPHNIINHFSEIIHNEHGKIVEQSSTEIVSRLLSKNDAIRVAIQLVGIGLNNNISVRASVGMTGAAAIERSINLNKEVGNVPGIGFTKLGGEYALVLDSKFIKSEGSSAINKNYLFIDMVDSTSFINKNGRDKLVDLMESIKKFIEQECNGKIEGYRQGGDDLIAEFPSKDLAIRAGLDSAWFVLNNGAKIRAGIGKSRREAGERAQLADEIKIQGSLSLVIFELANGVYSYYIPSEFIRTILNFILNKKSKIIGVFLFVFIVSYVLAIFGFGQLGIIPVILAAIYALIS
ncbi:hypothetical protein [Methanobrevibacter filiformis]|uniref:Uncharacterized protein n=1 Tax=Methanobrevibacter filiformis TaxID=55758 RepID=A0A166DA08_9EURY|nr:hypothetical protein [Methanobrevibacter filiformis]KZX15361.1 hypothetical protein MBFIL_06620 [Methanobrevibacter filiformis]